LAGRAEEHSEDSRTSNPSQIGSGRKPGLDDVRNQRAEHDQVDDVEEVTGSDERNHPYVQG
jgi:hypothetical protein